MGKWKKNKRNNKQNTIREGNKKNGPNKYRESCIGIFD